MASKKEIEELKETVAIQNATINIYKTTNAKLEKIIKDYRIQNQNLLKQKWKHQISYIQQPSNGNRLLIRCSCEHRWYLKKEPEMNMWIDSANKNFMCPKAPKIWK